jgi:3-hydroxyacyl-CoA dehydrogenase
MTNWRIENVVVIGAGTMGAALAAHFANAGLKVTLLDIVPNKLTSKEEMKELSIEDPVVRNRIVNEGWQRCIKARPANLFSNEVADLVTLGNLEDDFDAVAEADWILEAIVERLDIKQPLMARIDKVRKPESIVPILPGFPSMRFQRAVLITFSSTSWEHTSSTRPGI